MSSKKMTNEEFEARKFSVECHKCSRREDMDSCRLCKTCALEANVDIEKEVDEKKIAPFVFCSSCASENHTEKEKKEHTVIKYRTYKNAMLCAEAHKNVNELVEVCENAFAEAREQLEEFRKQVFEELALGTKKLSVRKFEKLAYDRGMEACCLQDGFEKFTLDGLEEFTSEVATSAGKVEEAIENGMKNEFVDEDGGGEDATVGAKPTVGTMKQ